VSWSRLAHTVFRDAGREYVGATVTGRRMATRAMATATAAEQQDDKEQDQDESDASEHLHPAWCALGRSAVWLHAGVVVGITVSHIGSFCRGWVAGFARQYV
ncbi:MAG: hypothetical protein LC777_19155, partial [Actinobacteria bacterium]|nr:hypothetical protein [Actinomycetota bacterium]